MGVRVAVVSMSEVVEAGVRVALQGFPSRVEVAPPSEAERGVDVVLWSGFGGHLLSDLEEVRCAYPGVRIAVLCWNFDPRLVERCFAAGASGYLSTALTSAELVDAVERIQAGESVVAAPTTTRADAGWARWPGQAHGLSEREADIVTLISSGLSNGEIADRLYLSINTVKSYVRTAYRKMGVANRPQAVLWGIEHGMHRRRVAGPAPSLP